MDASQNSFLPIAKANIYKRDHGFPVMFVLMCALNYSGARRGRTGLLARCARRLQVRTR